MGGTVGGTADADRLRELHAAGLSDLAIAAALGVTRKIVWYHRRRLGLATVGRGRRGGLTPPQQELAADPRHVGIALALARKWARGGLREDAEGAGLVGLVKAARDYDPAAGVRFATYLAHRVRGEVLDYLRVAEGVGMGWQGRSSAAPRPRVQQFARLAVERVRGGPGADDRDIPDAAAEADAADRDGAEAVVALTRRLPGDERAAVRAYYLTPATYRQVGRGLGLSEARAHQLVAAGLGRLRKQLAGGDR